MIIYLSLGHFNNQCHDCECPGDKYMIIRHKKQKQTSKPLALSIRFENQCRHHCHYLHHPHHDHYLPQICNDEHYRLYCDDRCINNQNQTNKHQRHHHHPHNDHQHYLTNNVCINN